MIRHGMVDPSAAGAPPPVTDPPASIANLAADMAPSEPVPGRQYRAKEQRSGLSASTSALSRGISIITDIGRRSKSP
ncbi:hypothetical protein BFN67_16685 [Pseudaminobacter manganicus]|uniref:Uncharacterized protein n=1 Tax=Manganibacter manganicus TaxID=1873176 RepID=A0A1V8RSE4_9HYPH|nr:hypothetical protein BFN67_23060 [Pseudaminobacter manganicus]OQM74166.1 hypothetical protein BFN67_22475 [Pseudaminobacter manganicus]OQM74182.1 hypothetical protein BFN67_22380 [Pseudaminobacter manganicus]OQM76075.1 hypothetical protein BFN67_16685 [Pseudaminobacter manganicus]